MARCLVYLYRGPEGLVASETQLDGAPLLGRFERAGQSWQALGLGRMLDRTQRIADIEPIPLAVLAEAAAQLDRRHA